MSALAEVLRSAERFICNYLSRTKAIILSGCSRSLHLYNEPLLLTDCLLVALEKVLCVLPFY